MLYRLDTCCCISHALVVLSTRVKTTPSRVKRPIQPMLHFAHPAENKTLAAHTCLLLVTRQSDRQPAPKLVEASLQDPLRLI